MICPKIRRCLLGGPVEQEEEIVTGICDYIPLALKAQPNINIAIVGNQTQVVNQILWNEFFAKSLIKEAYYFLMHTYATEGRQATSAVFAKRDGKVYKMEEIMDWKSQLREALLKDNSEVVTLELEAFSNKGNIRKINLFLSKYPVAVERLHLVLKAESMEVAKISKNEFASEAGTDEFRLLEETDRSNKNHENSVNTHKTKYSQLSHISLKTKQSVQSKQNCKQYSSKTPSKVSSKKSDLKRKKQKNDKSFETAKDMPSKSVLQAKETLASLTPQRNPINRESVLAKIITSKEQQIISLKEQLDDKTYEYELLIREQDEAHKKEIEKMTKSVKEVLDSYSASQKEALNENAYLKERVRVLEESLDKTNSKLESYTQQMENYVVHVRQLQDVNKRLSSTNKTLLQQQDRNRSAQIAEFNRMNSQILAWKQKAQEFRVKYDKIVEVMRSVINLS